MELRKNPEPYSRRFWNIPSEIHNSKADRRGTGELSDSAEVDLDVGDTNDFEINTAVSEYDAKRIGYGCKIFIPGTEYGGIIGDIESNTNEEKVVIRGRTWRGMLQYKVVEPPAGQDHLVLSGELNTAIRTLIGDRFGDLMVIQKWIQA